MMTSLWVMDSTNKNLCTAVWTKICNYCLYSCNASYLCMFLCEHEEEIVADSASVLQQIRAYFDEDKTSWHKSKFCWRYVRDKNQLECVSSGMLLSFRKPTSFQDSKDRLFKSSRHPTRLVSQGRNGDLEKWSSVPEKMLALG